MEIGKNAVINYQGSQIALFSDDRADYVSLTDIVKAWNKYSKSISAWLKTKQALEFLHVWEKKNNPNYNETQLSRAISIGRERNGLSAQQWIDLTGASGIFTRMGIKAGTYAHKDIAIRFAGWLNPEFELYLIDEIKRLKEIEKQKDSFELLSHEQILALIRLKEVFKYVSNQEAIENAHKDVYAAHSTAKNPFADFQSWRNKILDISPAVIDNRIKEYCKANNIALNTKIEKKSRKEKILFYDSYIAVKNAVWDFLQLKGEVNALNLATLVENIIRTEKGEVLRKNEDNLFQTKQELGEFEDFDNKINNMREVIKAREYLKLVEKYKQEFKSLPKSTLKPFPKKEYDADYDF